eukprot:GHUV01048951.1.p1 GENE.GHUV01048951.1~~GHUV01048951.1.p1  ORF type:complete len:102 (-),score=6.95 GHUV01048951.1:85-390(-)
MLPSRTRASIASRICATLAISCRVKPAALARQSVLMAATCLSYSSLACCCVVYNFTMLSRSDIDDLSTWFHTDAGDNQYGQSTDCNRLSADTRHAMYTCEL